MWASGGNKNNKDGDERKKQYLKTCTHVHNRFNFNHQKVETVECLSISE